VFFDQRECVRTTFALGPAVGGVRKSTPDGEWPWLVRGHPPFAQNLVTDRAGTTRFARDHVIDRAGTAP
jgi:hypothetical protein